MMGTHRSVGVGTRRKCPEGRGPADMACIASPTTVNAAPTIDRAAPGPLGRARAARDHIYRSGSLPDQAGTPLPVWPSGVTKERGEAIRDLALSVNAATCVETGFGYGMSA